MKQCWNIVNLTLSLQWIFTRNSYIFISKYRLGDSGHFISASVCQNTGTLYVTQTASLLLCCRYLSIKQYPDISRHKADNKVWYIFFKVIVVIKISNHNWPYMTSLNMAMMTSSYRNIFRVTGPLSGKTKGRRWIPLTKANDVELWCFLWSAFVWASNREASDLRRHRAHYDVTVMAPAT